MEQNGRAKAESDLITAHKAHVPDVRDDLDDIAGQQRPSHPRQPANANGASFEVRPPQWNQSHSVPKRMPRLPKMNGFGLVRTNAFAIGGAVVTRSLP